MSLAPDEIEQWYKTYGPMVYRRCLRLLACDEWAREAMQDVFVKVLRRADQLGAEAPSSLLYRVATNVCLNLIRDRGIRLESPGGDLLERIAALTDFESNSATRQLLSRLFAGEVESTRVLAVLHFVDGFTLEEVARAVNLSVSGVRKRLVRLRENLKKLDGMGPLRPSLDVIREDNQQ